MTGSRQYCPDARGQKYTETEQGAFGNYVIKQKAFIFPIPEGLEFKYAAPLQCAGFSPDEWRLH